MRSNFWYALLFIHIFVLSASSGLANQLESKSLGKSGYARSLRASSVAEISNSYIKAAIASDGTFTLGNTGGDPNNTKDDDQILLFGHPSPWSSWTVVSIDNIDYTFGSGGTWITAPSVQGGKLVAAWSINNITITQTLSIIRGFSTGREDNLEIKYEINNADSVSHSIGIRPMLDTMLGNNDGAPFRVLGFGEVRKEKEWISSVEAIPQYCQVFDNFDDPTVISMFSFTGIGFVDPDRLVLCYWPNVNNSWDYTIDPNCDFLDNNADGTISGYSPDSDSAILVYWNPVSLSPGQAKIYGFTYGLGGMTYIEWDPFNIGLSAPEFLSISDGDYIPNPFTAVCYLKNSSGSTVLGATVKFDSVPGLILDAGEEQEKALGETIADEIKQKEWKIRALGSVCGYVDLSVTCSAEGKSITIFKPIYIPAFPNSLHGKITNMDVLPLANATIRVYQNGVLVATTAAFPDGTFLIKDLPVGQYQVVVSAPGYANFTLYANVSGDTNSNNINVVLFAATDDDEQMEAFCYPNPVRQNTAKVVFYTGEAAEVKLELFTTAGKRIKTYNASTNGPGHQEINLDIGEFANGVYIYRVTSNWGGKKRTATHKMAVIKR